MPSVIHKNIQSIFIAVYIHTPFSGLLTGSAHSPAGKKSYKFLPTYCKMSLFEAKWVSA